MLKDTRINLMIALLTDLKKSTDLVKTGTRVGRDCVNWEMVYEGLPEALRAEIEAQAAAVR